MPKKRKFGRSVLRQAPIESWSFSTSYRPLCVFRETPTGSWTLLKKQTRHINFPVSIDNISRYWVVEFTPRHREVSGFKIPSKTLRIPLAQALQLGNRDKFDNEAELLDQLKKTAESISLSEVAATLRESLQLTP